MNETTSTAGAVVAAYIGAVRDELADLPDDARIDLIDDVAEHVSAVAAEYDTVTMTALVERLGAPSEYAAELRDAAGLGGVSTADEAVTGDGFFRRLGRFITAVLAVGAAALVLMGILVQDVGPLWFAGFVVAAAVGMLAMLTRDGREWRSEAARLPGASVLRRARVWFVEQTWSDEAVDLTVSLRPGWWILRGAALAVAMGMFANSFAMTAVLVLPLVAVSVWWGRRTVRDTPTGRSHLAAAAVNGALALTVIGAAIGVYERAAEPPIYLASDPYEEVYGEAGPMDDGMVYREGGSMVTNLFPYGPDGQLLEGVRLYDQDGRPFELGLAEGCDEWGEYGWVYLPHGDPANAYPHRLIEADPETGECRDPVMVPPFGPFLPGSPVTDDASPDTESQGTESQGTESQGTESQGTESQGTESQGTESQDPAPEVDAPADPGTATDPGTAPDPDAETVDPPK